MSDTDLIAMLARHYVPETPDAPDEIPLTLGVTACTMSPYANDEEADDLLVDVDPRYFMLNWSQSTETKPCISDSGANSGLLST